MKKGQQILKTRDDSQPILLENNVETDDETKPFLLTDDCECSWLKKGEAIGPSKLRSRIEPWLTALCQSEHLSLLVGSGLTHAVHQLATNKPMPGMNMVKFNNHETQINAEVERSAKVAGRKEGNFEDQIRVANELLQGLRILSASGNSHGEEANQLQEELSKVLTSFADTVLRCERNIITANDKEREEAFNYLVSFLMSFASRSGTRDRLNLFTTNYDRLIEAGSEVAGMRLLDRFVGSLAPIFRSSRLDIDMHYNPPGIRGEPRYLEGIAHFTKLHGSLDWFDHGQNIRRHGVPFGATKLKPYLMSDHGKEFDGRQLMIYPNSAKDRETSVYPYVELFRDFASATCRPNHTLIVFGYSFGDEHINRVIEDMLTIPSTHLVVIAYDDPLDRIMNTYDRLGRSAQISLLLGDHIGNFKPLVDHYLPKPAIDRTTFRMAELLKSRWNVNETPRDESSSEEAAQGGGEV